MSLVINTHKLVFFWTPCAIVADQYYYMDSGDHIQSLMNYFPGCFVDISRALLEVLTATSSKQPRQVVHYLR